MRRARRSVTETGKLLAASAALVVAAGTVVSKAPGMRVFGMTSCARMALEVWSKGFFRGQQERDEASQS